MIKQRIITALILVSLILLAIIFLPFYLFAIFSTLLMLFAAWEWCLLVGIHKRAFRLVYVVCVGLFMFLAWHAPVLPVLIIAVLFWLVGLYFIVRYPKSSLLWSHGFLVRAMMGLLVIVPCWLALNMLRAAQDGSQIIIFMLFLIWAVDTGAYFTGKNWGKHKLCPRVSPNKTWEGVYGGLLLTGVIAATGCMLMNVAPIHWASVIILALLTAAFSVIGDLFESMLKREVGIKDTGRYLPGHGGFLDRIDSLLAAAPLFLLGLVLLGLL